MFVQCSACLAWIASRLLNGCDPSLSPSRLNLSSQVVLQSNPGVPLLHGVLQPAEQQDVMFLQWPRLPTLPAVRSAADAAVSGGSPPQSPLDAVMAFRRSCRFGVSVRLCSPRYRDFGWSLVRCSGGITAGQGRGRAKAWE
jgi:hypothetical protein